jgi:chaperonin GroES
MENYSARRDRLLVEVMTVTKAEETTPSGIVMPVTVNQQRDALKRATVMAVGPGIYNLNGTVNPVNINMGDTVLIGPHAGIELRLNGSKYLSIVESDIHGVVTTP